MYSTKVVVVCILLARVIVESMHNIIIIMQNMILYAYYSLEYAVEHWCTARIRMTAAALSVYSTSE